MQAIGLQSQLARLTQSVRDGLLWFMASFLWLYSGLAKLKEPQ